MKADVYRQNREILTQTEQDVRGIFKCRSYCNRVSLFLVTLNNSNLVLYFALHILFDPKLQLCQLGHPFFLITNKLN